MSEKVEPSKPSPAATHEALPAKNDSPNPAQPKKLLQTTPLLLVHTARSIALALVLVYAVDRYNAGDDSTLYYVDGTLLLQSSDVTTLILAALVFIKFFTISWAAIATWRGVWELTHLNIGLTSKQVSFMTRYKLLPWMRSLFRLLSGCRNWAVAIFLLCSFP